LVSFTSVGGRCMFNPTSLRVAPLLASWFLHLQQVGPSPLGTPMVPGTALGVHTPLSVKAWSLLLADHPNRTWVDSLLKGLERGVRVGSIPIPVSVLHTTTFYLPVVTLRWCATLFGCRASMWQCGGPIFLQTAASRGHVQPFWSHSKAQ